MTLPWPVFAKTAGTRLKAASTGIDWDIDFRGVINHLLFLKRPLTKHYWLATPGTEHPFDGIVETSTLTEETDRGERHVVYLTKYLHRNDPRFSQLEAEIKSNWFTTLQKLFPNLKIEDIETQFIFRAPFVGPVYTPEVMVPDRIFLATTTQVYPIVTSWNGSVIQAERTLEGPV